MWVLGTVAVLIAATIAVLKFRASKDEGAFQEQLQLARSEGIPTSATEFKALIKPATPAENAAPLYRKLRDLLSQQEKERTRTKSPSVSASELATAVTFHPSGQNMAKAKALLAQNRDELALIDQAVLRPRCWFDRDWSLGPATLFPELHIIRKGAELVGLRGAVAAASNDSKAAIEDTQRIFVMSRHVGEEPQHISRFLQDFIYRTGLSKLAGWTFVHRDQPLYKKELEKALGELPRPNLREENSEDLYSTLTLIELCSTPEGREKLGLREEDIGKIESLMPLIASRAKAKVGIVKAERAYWAALALPRKGRNELLMKAKSDLFAALSAYPTALNVYSNLSSSEPGDSEDGATAHEEIWEETKLRYTALLRAFAGKEIAKSIKTSDLLNPSDGKPIKYFFTHGRITIGFTSGRSNLYIPPLDPIKMPSTK